MFTGIIEATAPIVLVSREGTLHVRIKTPRGWKLARGESINVDGICSTVIKNERDTFSIRYTPTTLRKTTAAFFDKGVKVNLERSLRYGNRMSGHFVLGHVDARATVTGVTRGKNAILTIALPRPLRRFVVLRGSVAINGVSLTIASVSPPSFSVALIPYTTAHTTLGKLEKGDVVNIEVDVLARYGRDRVSRLWRK